MPSMMLMDGDQVCVECEGSFSYERHLMYKLCQGRNRGGSYFLVFQDRVQAGGSLALSIIHISTEKTVLYKYCRLNDGVV